MREKLLTLALALALLCSACSQAKTEGNPPPEGQYSVYFAAVQGRENGAALGQEFRSLPADCGEVEGLVRLLLSGPESADLMSPFPRGTSLRGWQVEDGVAVIDLSEAYSGLSGVDLSLADGCITLTLCQLEEVEKVYLTVEGRARPFRDQVLTPMDFLLDNGSGGVAEVKVQLWFLLGVGLAKEERILDLSVGDQVHIAALKALFAGPEGSGLKPVCSEETELLSLERQGKCFTVNLSAAWMEESGVEDPRRIYAIVNTLAGITPEAGVLFQIEGWPLEQFGGLDLTEPLKADPPQE